MTAPGVLATALIALLTKPLLMQTEAAPRTIDTGARSNIDSPRQVVARTDEEWIALWRQHMPERQRAAVDFSKETIVGVFLGSRPTAGYGVAIVSAVEADGVLRVRYRETAPPPGAITAQVITFPYHLAAIPRSSAREVKFEKLPSP